MRSRLVSMFEEDIEMMDAIEDLQDGLYDDDDELVMSVIDSRYKDDKDHLFTEPDENEVEAQKYTDLLLNDEDIENDDVEDLADEEFPIDDEEVDIEDLLDDDF